MWEQIKQAMMESARERCLEVYKQEKKKIKRYIYQSKKEVHEQFRKKMNHDVNRNMKLFRKELSKASGGKVGK